MLMYTMILQFYAKNCLGYELMLSFWSLTSNGLYIISAVYTPTLNKYMLSILKFPTVSHLKSVIYIHYGSEKCKH